MAITISLADLVVTTAGTFDDAVQVVHIGGKAITAVRSADGKVLTLPGYGTLTFINDAPNHVAFQGDAALAGGEYAFESQGSNAIVTVADFSNVTAAVTVNGAFDEIIGGMGDDMLRGAAYSGNIIQGGAGNDTITADDSIESIDAGAGDDLVDIGGGSQKVSLGAGADTVRLLLLRGM